MTEKPNEDGFLISEEFLDEGPSPLERVLLDALDRDRVGMADKTWRNHRQAIRKIVPHIEHAGIFTLDQLTDSDALLALRVTLREAIKAGIVGSPGTVESYTGKFATRCASAGLSPEDTARLRGTLRQARKGAMKAREVEPELTHQHLRDLNSTMESWLNHPTEVRGRVGSRGTDAEVLVGITGYRERPVTALRRDRVLGFAALQLSGALRTGSVLEILRGDVRGRHVRFLLTKGHIDPTVKTFDIHSEMVRFVTPLLERFPNPEDRLFPTKAHQVSGDLRALMLQAKIPEHHGRLGLHRVRKSFIKANYDAGRSAAEASAGLGNSPAVAEKSYGIHTRADQDDRSRQAWMDTMSAALVDPPDWKWDDESFEPQAWERLHPWYSTTDPLNLGPAMLIDLPVSMDPSAFRSLWRLRYVWVAEDDDGSDWWVEGWRRYGCYESIQGDVVIAMHTKTGTAKHPDNPLTVSTYRPLWLRRGGMHRAWMVGLPGFEPESRHPSRRYSPAMLRP